MPGGTEAAYAYAAAGSFLEFYRDGENAPRVEIEYAYNQNIRYQKNTLDLVGGVVTEVNYSTGEKVESFTDISGEYSVMGLAVRHVHKVSDRDFAVGDNFRLNLHENFRCHAENLYVYTDANGDAYAFNQYHYKLNSSGEKVYLTVDKSKITVQSDGTLRYGGDKVYTEYKSMTGLTALTRLDDYQYLQYFERRGDEEKQLEETVRAYREALDEITLDTAVNTAQIYHLSDYISTHEDFEKFLYWAEKGTLSNGGEAVSAENKEDTVESIRQTYKEYVNKQAELEDWYLQSPVSYLTDGKIIKGYNKYGQLVAVFDKYDHYAVIEYERYGTDKTRIARMYDENERQVTFGYNSNDLLTSITDVTGRKTTYEYGETDYLSTVRRGEEMAVTFSYTDDAISSVSDEATKKAAYLEYTDTYLSLYYESTVNVVSIDGASGTPIYEMPTFVVQFNRNTDGTVNNTTEEYEGVIKKYVFDSVGNLTEYYLVQNGVVAAAERYEYVPYWNGTTQNSDPRYVVMKAKKSSLYVSALNAFTFEAEDTSKELFNMFEKVYQKTTEEKLPPYMSYANAITTVTDYTYDDDQKLLQEKSAAFYLLSLKQSRPIKNTPTTIWVKSSVRKVMWTGKNIRRVRRCRNGRTATKATWRNLARTIPWTAAVNCTVRRTMTGKVG